MIGSSGKAEVVSSKIDSLRLRLATQFKGYGEAYYIISYYTHHKEQIQYVSVKKYQIIFRLLCLPRTCTVMSLGALAIFLSQTSGFYAAED